MNWKFARMLTAVATAWLLSACSTTTVVKEYERDTPAGPRPDKIAVVVMIPDALQRLSVERVLVDDINKAGGNAKASSEIRGMRGKLDRKKAEAALKAWGADSAVVVFLRGAIKGEELERADYWMMNVGSGVSYNWFAPQFVEVYTVMEGPGYYDQERELYVESSYFDFRSQEPRWTLITKSTALEYRDTAKSISGKIVSKMKRDGAL